VRGYGTPAGKVNRVAAPAGVRDKEAVAEPDLALFRAFPALRQRLPRHPLLCGPTPVEPLPLPGFAERRLWVKRDERSAAGYGGNKPRKLEWLLGHALARRARRLVTTGGLGSHHGLATAIHGRDAGLTTTLVLVHQPVTDAVRRTLLLDAAWGAELVYGGNVPGAALRGLAVLAAAVLRGERPYLVPTGGSSTRGNVGFVSAGLELAEQIRAGSCPLPAQIFLAVGTGGTLAGLVAGLALAGLRCRPVGVLVTDILPPSRPGIARAARATLAWLHRHDPSLPRVGVTERDFDLVVRQRGAGYGAPTAAGATAIEAARGVGLELESSYTGKCLAEILERRRSGQLPAEPVLFWNTYNGVDPAARVPRPLDPALLPPRFRSLLELPAAD